MNAEILVGIGTGLSVLLIGQLKNRKDIAQIKSWIWGYEGASGDGANKKHETLEDKIDHIEEILEDEKRHRSRDHDELMHEVYVNRISQLDTIDSIAEILSEEDDLSDVDIDTSDIKPPRLTDEDVKYAQMDDK